jgi:hypothetical protein
MEKQLTAVEWLHEQFKAGFNYNIEEGYEKRRDELFEEAKEIEHAQLQMLKTQTHPVTKNEALAILEKFSKVQDALDFSTDQSIIDKCNKHNEELGEVGKRYYDLLAIESAKIAVDLIINCECLHYPEDRLYWKSVKKELELM